MYRQPKLAVSLKGFEAIKRLVEKGEAIPRSKAVKLFGNSSTASRFFEFHGIKVERHARVIKPSQAKKIIAKYEEMTEGGTKAPVTWTGERKTRLANAVQITSGRRVRTQSENKHAPGFVKPMNTSTLVAKENPEINFSGAKKFGGEQGELENVPSVPVESTTFIVDEHFEGQLDLVFEESYKYAALKDKLQDLVEQQQAVIEEMKISKARTLKPMTEYPAVGTCKAINF